MSLSAHLAWSVAFQFKHIHGVVDPAAEMVKLDISSQAMNPHLYLENNDN